MQVTMYDVESATVLLKAHRMRLPAERNGARSSGHSLRHVRGSRKGKQQFRRRQTVGFFHQAFLGGIIYQEKNGRPSQPKRFMRVMASSRPQKERVSVISFGFEGTEIKGHSHGYGKHHRFQPEGIEHQEDAMQEVSHNRLRARILARRGMARDSRKSRI